MAQHKNKQTHGQTETSTKTSQKSKKQTSKETSMQTQPYLELTHQFICRIDLNKLLCRKKLDISSQAKTMKTDASKRTHGRTVTHHALTPLQTPPQTHVNTTATGTHKSRATDTCTHNALTATGTHPAAKHRRSCSRQSRLTDEPCRC